MTTPSRFGVTVIAIGVLLASCARGGDGAVDGRRSLQAGVGTEVYTFTSLEQMAATSDLVIEGRVEATEPGRELGEESGHTIQFQLVTVKVLHTFKGDAQSSSLLLEEEIEDSFAPGDRAFFFLHRKLDRDKEPYYFRLVNTQGEFLLDGEQVVASNDEYDWVREVESASPDELWGLVEQAVEADAQPAEPIFSGD